MSSILPLFCCSVFFMFAGAVADEDGEDNKIALFCSSGIRQTVLGHRVVWRRTRQSDRSPRVSKQFSLATAVAGG